MSIQGDYPHLQAILGVYGIRTSRLADEKDYWCAATNLFPGAVKAAEGLGLAELQEQVRAIPKRERKRLGSANLRNLPSEWISSSAAHQQKLRAAS